MKSQDTHPTFTAIGNAVATEGWGPENLKTIDQALDYAQQSPRNIIIICLLADIAKTLKEISSTLGHMEDSLANLESK